MRVMKVARRVGLTGAMVGALAASLAACGGSSSHTSSASTGASAGATGGSSSASVSGNVAKAQALAAKAEVPPTKIPQTVALKSKPPAGKLIIDINNELAATVQMQKAQQAATAALGWRFENLSYDAANAATLEAALKTALQKKPAAVTITGSPPSTYGASTLAAYKAAGIPIVAGVVYPFTATDPLLGDPSGGTAEQAGGGAVADWFIADSHGQGKAVLETVTAYPIYNAFNQGFEAEVKALCPGCAVKTFDVSASSVDANQTVPLAVSQMRSSSDYKYLFFDNGEYADGIGAALANAGLSDVKVGGRSIDQNGLATLKTTGGAWTGTNYDWIGYSLIDVAARHIEGMAIPAADSEGMWQLITPNNVNSVTLPYQTPVDALDQFKKLWHVG